MWEGYIFSIDDQKSIFLKPSLVVGNTKAWITTENGNMITIEHTSGVREEIVATRTFTVKEYPHGAGSLYNTGYTLSDFKLDPLPEVYFARALVVRLSGIIPGVYLTNRSNYALSIDLWLDEYSILTTSYTRGSMEIPMNLSGADIDFSNADYSEMTLMPVNRMTYSGTPYGTSTLSLTTGKNNPIYGKLIFSKSHNAAWAEYTVISPATEITFTFVAIY